MPKTFSPEERATIIPKVIKGLSEGTPLTVICREEGMPCDNTIRSWGDDDAGLAADIAYARDSGWDAIASRTRETARGKGDSTADVQRDKLIIDTDLKLLAKWDKKRYGDKLDVAHTGGVKMIPMTAEDEEI